MVNILFFFFFNLNVKTVDIKPELRQYMPRACIRSAQGSKLRKILAIVLLNSPEMRRQFTVEQRKKMYKQLIRQTGWICAI